MPTPGLICSALAAERVKNRSTLGVVADKKSKYILVILFCKMAVRVFFRTDLDCLNFEAKFSFLEDLTPLTYCIRGQFESQILAAGLQKRAPPAAHPVHLELELPASEPQNLFGDCQRGRCARGFVYQEKKRGAWRC